MKNKYYNDIFKIQNKYFKILFFLILLFSISFLSISNITNTNLNAASDDDLNELRKERDELQDNIDRIKEEKDQVNQKIDQYEQDKSQLAGEAQYIENVINQNELQVDSIELELKKLTLDLEIIQEEKAQAEEELEEVEKELDKLKKDQVNYNNYLFKLSLNSHNILSPDSTLEQNIVDTERAKTVVKIIKSNVDKANKLAIKVKEKNNEVAAKEEEISEIVKDKEAYSIYLTLQESGLKAQKENKLKLIEQREEDTEELAQKEQELNNELSQYQQKLNSILNALFQAPPGGTRVASGQVIGFQGRTGLSCNPIEDGVARTNTFCQSYAGLSDYWYYYDPQNYPTKGSHLHFAYNKGGVEVNPYNYLFEEGNKEFENKPMDSMMLTQGFHGGHPANDLVSYHGAPVYAIKPGTISYHCDSWLPADFPDPGYGAIIHHDDGTKSAYWHMQKRPESPRGANCNF